MASQTSPPNPHQVPQSNPFPTPSAPPEPTTTTTATTSSSSSLYPSIDTSDLTENLFADAETGSPVEEETLLRVPGVVLHLIDPHRSIELASGDFAALRLQCVATGTTVAVLARVGDVQWPLTPDTPAVRLAPFRYFFSLRVPEEDGAVADVLNYGLTFAPKGQEELLQELDGILERYTSFSVQNVSGKAGAGEVLDGSVVSAVAPAEVAEAGPKKEMMAEQSAAYWTTLAPNVEDYGGGVAKAIAAGSGQLVKGILWCGEVTVDRLKVGNDLLKKRLEPNQSEAEISPEALRRIKRVKRVTKMSEKVATGILSGVVRVSGYVTSSIVNSKAGKKIFGLVPGEILLASLDGFGKICDAFEVAGKNVLSTSSNVTSELVTHRYGAQAAEITNEGLGAAGHALGTAWAVFKIRKALDPKSSIKPHTLAKSSVKAAVAEIKAKRAK